MRQIKSQIRRRARTTVALVSLFSVLLASCDSVTESDPREDAGTSLPQTQSDSFDFVTFETVEEMAASSTIVMVGTVTAVESRGLGDVEEDPNPTEYVAVIVDPDKVIKGDPEGPVSYLLSAFVTDGAGRRLYELVTDGLPIPIEGDQLLLFLQPEERQGSPLLENVSHMPVNSSGVAFVEGEVVTTASESNGLIEDLQEMSIDDLQAAVVP